MSEYSRYGSGAAMPSEQRRVVEAEHEKDLVEMGRKAHLAHETHRAGKRPWWRFWAPRPAR
jgi:hypothetical protein